MKNNCTTAVFLISLVFWATVRGQQQIVVQPAPIDAILYNPGIGVEVFHQGTQPASFPPSRIFYWRFNWIDIETQRGQIDFDRIDRELATARAKGQRVGIRILAVNDYGCEVCVPQYVVDDAGGVMVSAGADGGPYSQVFWPNYNTAFMDDVEALMTALGQRYDGHPDLNHVDMSFFGCWGEYNSACTEDAVQMWTPEIQNRNTDIHFAAFPNTPIIAQGGDTYATDRSAGWRGDCFGDWGMFGSGWNHMENSYPASAEDCGDCWQTGMVSFEVCGVLQTQYDNGYDFSLTMEKGLEWHMSSMNAKSSAIPEAYMPVLNEALKTMGYRLRIARLEHPSHVAAGGAMPVLIDWVNEGVAPPYHRYVLRMELVPASGGVPWGHDFNVDVRGWLPGAFSMQENISLPADLAMGGYSMRLALLFTDTRQPAIELAMEGRDPLGWYPLSQVTVADQAGIPNDFTFPFRYMGMEARPNPFMGSTLISMKLPVAGMVDVAVYSPGGKKLRTLWNGPEKAGSHRLLWNGEGDDGSPLPRGFYFIRGNAQGTPFSTITLVHLGYHSGLNKPQAP
jgi:hypothetical protein